jgi:hypothetical protein
MTRKPEKPAYVPVITEAQVERLTDLVRRIEAIRRDVDEALMSISASLDVLRDENHPEGWAKVTVVPDLNVSCVVVEHKRARK